MVNLPCRSFQVDELWGFIACEGSERDPEDRGTSSGRGFIWLWVSMCADTKVVPCVALARAMRPTPTASSPISLHVFVIACN